MNKEEIITKLGEELLSGIDFAQTQTPILCEQIVQYGVINNTIEIILSLLFLVFVAFFVRWQIKSKLLNDINDFHWSYLIDLACFIVSVISITCMICALNPLLKAIFAPYVYVIDYLRYF